MIEVENLTKDYGTHLGIDGLTFSAEKGELLGFLGPNGAGKTTTMRILTCFFPATGGKAVVAGFDCFEDSLEVRKRLGYLPENVPLYKDIAVEDYLNFVAGVKGVDAKDVKRRVGKVVSECGLAEYAKRMIGELSKGYRQRVGLAQALVNDPEILVLDEPTNGLDPRQIKEIRKLIIELAGQRTVILSSHILPEVSMVCKKIVIIDKGKLVAVDTPENLVSNLHEATKMHMIINGPSQAIMKEIRQVKGVAKVEHDKDSNVFIVSIKKGADARQSIPPVIVNNNWDLVEMRAVQASLEDVFLHLVTKEEGA
ncbi:MAG: MFS transporter [Rhodospirillales bacterium RIFCSPLOWO2_12_FULL_58_28]|nr:MAG: MFS transporter [Rhodospirillales bacterium RIFCSPLOWO2_02_FULL_58_16]OHC79892.1 MAG: MFS transporter [Rhodospirillales bacterium RIFCSPLOWO2_12_FULL_58_28]